MSGKTFRVAVIGCGAICSNHISGILSAEHTVCALCDIVPQKAYEIAKKHGLDDTPVYTDYKAMLDEIQPDAVHICTPHYLHAEMTVEALNRGIHVLCEKPLAVNEAQLASVLLAERNSTAKLGVCLQNRYEPSMIRLRECCSAGTVNAAFADVIWNRDAAYYRSGDWRGKWATEGGGVLINQALHTLDLLQWICGTPVSVTAHTFNDHLTDVIEVEDTVVARLVTENGAVLNFFATTAAGNSFSAHLRIRLSDKTILHAENEMFVKAGKLNAGEEREIPIGKSVWGTGHRHLIKDFYRCLATGDSFPINGCEAAKSLRTVFAIYRSNGTPVPLQEKQEPKT